MDIKTILRVAEIIKKTMKGWVIEDHNETYIVDRIHYIGGISIGATITIITATEAEEMYLLFFQPEGEEPRLAALHFESYSWGKTHEEYETIGSWDWVDYIQRGVTD